MLDSKIYQIVEHLIYVQKLSSKSYRDLKSFKAYQWQAYLKRNRKLYYFFLTEAI